jgi:hypothetical protein
MGKVRSFSKHIFWTDAETALIVDLYPRAAYDELLTTLPGRSKSQIQNRAHALGIFREKKPKMSAEETREAKRKGAEKNREKNPERIRNYQRTQYHKNRDRNLATMKKYQRKRFFWMRAVKLKTVSAKDLAKLWKRQRGKCALTGRKLDRTAQIDHILSKARGGTDELENLRWLCKQANLARRELNDLEFEALCKDVVTTFGTKSA